MVLSTSSTPLAQATSLPAGYSLQLNTKFVVMLKTPTEAYLQVPSLTSQLELTILTKTGKSAPLAPRQPELIRTSSVTSSHSPRVATQSVTSTLTWYTLLQLPVVYRLPPITSTDGPEPSLVTVARLTQPPLPSLRSAQIARPGSPLKSRPSSEVTSLLAHTLTRPTHPLNPQSTGLPAQLSRASPRTPLPSLSRVTTTMVRSHVLSLTLRLKPSTALTTTTSLLLNKSGSDLVPTTELLKLPRPSTLQLTTQLLKR